MLKREISTMGEANLSIRVGAGRGGIWVTLVWAKRPGKML